MSWLFALSLLAAAFAPAAQPPPKLVAAPGGVVLMWGAGKSAVLRGKDAVANTPQVQTAEAGAVKWALVRWPHGTGGNKLWAFVQPTPGKLQLVWEGEDGPLDADGEASSRVALGTGGLVRSFTTSWLRRCDDEMPVWQIETFDVARRAFLQDAASPWQRLSATPATAMATPPLLAGQPWPTTGPRSFAFTAASSATAQTARALPSASVLNDLNTATAWRPWGSAGGFAFATARAPSDTAVTGLAFTKADGSAWPQKIWATFSSKQRFEVTVPDDAGATIWFVMPAPVPTSCVTIDVSAAAGAQAFGLAEVQVVTALNSPVAAEHVANNILSGINCSGGLQTLAGLNAPEVAKRLTDKLASASQAGQACAWEALATLPVQSVPSSSSWLSASLPIVLGAPSKLLRPQTLALWVERGGPVAWQALVAVVTDPTQAVRAQETAARLLASQASTVGLLLDQTGTLQGETKALVRRVLLSSPATSAPAVEKRLAQPVAKWLQDASATSELLWLATRLERQAGEPLWMPNADACAEDIRTPFALRARCLQALGASHAVNETLFRIAARDEDPVIRFLAFETLISKGTLGWTPRLEAALQQGLRDRDPRVRQTVARAFALAPAESAQRSMAALTKAYAAERWPFALAAYLESLAVGCLSPAPLESAAEREDVPLDGKIVALEGLAACKFATARPQALSALKRQVAPVPLREAAAKVLTVVGQPEDANTLQRVLRQATAAAASDPALDDVAAATLETLVALDPQQGTTAALELVKQTRPRLRRSGMAALGKLCGPQALGAIEAHLASTDAWLANAARQSKTQCEARSKTP